ncbi:hypothetical protein [Leucobacter luti]|uniref:hypothetical protein n=1 Tax=Leucobacter luti TaxID=340320 RepID=UPI00104F7658|nr:hypothetical protein [Leucobacter luti]MCW2287052.1 hypothetical protein [Leucobacter luti]
MIDFESTFPVGKRTCCDVSRKSGAVANIWLEEDVAHYVDELARAKQGILDADLTPGQHLDALGALDRLKAKAVKGQVEVGKTPDFLARQLTLGGGYILELRPRLGSRSIPPPRLFRLYYVEPARIEMALLPLCIGTKPRGEDIHSEQNESIDIAKGRSRLWQLTNQRRES